MQYLAESFSISVLQYRQIRITLLSLFLSLHFALSVPVSKTSPFTAKASCNVLHSNHSTVLCRNLSPKIDFFFFFKYHEPSQTSRSVHFFLMFVSHKRKSRLNQFLLFKYQHLYIRLQLQDRGEDGGRMGVGEPLSTFLSSASYRDFSAPIGRGEEE